MKRIALITILVTTLINSSSLLGNEVKHSDLLPPSESQKLSSAYNTYSFSLAFFENEKSPVNTEQTGDDSKLSTDSLSLRTKEAIAQFSLAIKDRNTFPFEIFPHNILEQKYKRHYSKTILEITGINLAVWAFDKYLIKESWADISLQTISNNFKKGMEWDNDTFITNQLGHPYHGAMFHSIARANGFNFFESTIYTTLGNFIWEFFLESNYPSLNDTIMTTLGGMTLGEALYRMAGLVVDEDSLGLGRALRETLAFFINPVFGLKTLTGNTSQIVNPSEKHYYLLDLPIGAYRSSTDKTSFVIATNFEYRDFLKNNPQVAPYDWFSLDCRFGFHEDGFRDKEIFTTGVIAGKKIKGALTGLFGVFDYMNTHTAEKMSVVGVGPGLVTVFSPDSSLYFNSSGVLSIIFGGTSPSIDSEEYHLGKKADDPYYLGPGMLGRIKLEFGKRGFGSILTGLSKYWVHSMITDANEWLVISSFNLRYDLSKKTQISLEYDYYLRNATLQEQSFSGANSSVRALYVLKF